MVRWNPHRRLSGGDIRVRDQLLRQAELPGRAESAKFDAFVSIHRLESLPIPTQVATMAVHMLHDGLKSTTVSTYVKKTASYNRASWSWGVYRQIRRVADTIEASGAGEGRREAAVWPLEDLTELTSRITENPFLRLCCDLLLHTPLRLSDINRLDGTQVRVGKSYVHLLLAGGKTRKRTKDREKRQYSRAEFSAISISLLQKREGKEGMLVQFSSRDLTRALQPFSKGRRISSYSFRNAYIKKLIREHTSPAGLVDWGRIASITGHRTYTSLKASYGYHLHDSD
jgi:hypothetical protein